MSKIIEAFLYFNEDGSAVAPSGPCSIWPREKGIKLMEEDELSKSNNKPNDTQVDASIVDMTKGFIGTAINFIAEGKAETELQKTRYNACLACVHFIEKTKQCSKCGCFMPAKTSVKKASCPIGIW